jgi:phospholipase C
MANPIKHLIVLMMENRSFDHYLGSLSLEGRADIEGFTNPLPVLKDKDGNDVPAWPMDGVSAAIPDPPHGWEAAHEDWNGGRNDGFVVQYQVANPTADKRVPMGYYSRRTLPVLYSLADQFTVCDHWFGSVLSSTWPNRKYLHSGRRDADNDTQTLPPFPGFDTIPVYNVLEDWPNPDRPGQTLSWKCYFSDLPFLAFWYKFAAFHALSNFAHVAEFVADCQTDRLPTISIIDPPFSLADDHPAHDPQLGEKFIGLIVDALTHSESWAASALLILYDENGGFFDHVPPPTCFEGSASEDNPLGFRVPAIVVSPYPRKTPSHKNYDHTSVMKSISEHWGVSFDQKFGPRWQNAPDIWGECFDFTQSPLPPGTYTGDPTKLSDVSIIHNLNWGSGVHDRIARPVDLLEGLLERIFILPELKALDRRSSVFDTLSALEDSVVRLKRMFK